MTLEVVVSGFILLMLGVIAFSLSKLKIEKEPYITFKKICFAASLAFFLTGIVVLFLGYFVLS